MKAMNAMKTMKVAIATQGPDMNSAVDPRFGRAKYFLVLDTETGDFTAHDNTQNLNASQGAGIQAGRNVIDLGVEAVLAGSVGPKAFATLQAGHITIHLGATGTAKNAIAQFKAGKLACATESNVEGHWA